MITNESARPNLRRILNTALKQLPEQAALADITYCIHNVLSEQGSSYLVKPEWLAFLEIDNPAHFYIGTNMPFHSLVFRSYIVSFIVQKNCISAETTVCLQLLDLIALLKKMPEHTVSNILKRYTILVKSLSADQKKLLVRLSRKYTPFVRTMLALVLESIDERNLSIKISDTLNPNTFKKYKQKVL